MKAISRKLMTDLTAHDRAILSAWKLGGSLRLFRCMEHGLIVSREWSVKCWCGLEAYEYIPCLEEIKKARK